MSKKLQIVGGLNLPTQKGLADNTVQQPGNIAGTLGYYYSYIDLENKQIYLTTERVIPQIGAGQIDTEFETPAYEVGGRICITNVAKFDYNETTNTAKVVSATNNVITYEGELGFTTITEEPIEGLSIDDYSVFVIEQPDVGITQVRRGAAAFGVISNSLGLYSFTEGGAATAIGNYSHAEGLYTEANYAAHSEGSNTKAYGQASHAEGQESNALGNQSHAEGFKTTANGRAAHAEGLSTEAIADNAHAEGNTTHATAPSAHAEGNGTFATEANAHAEGLNTEATGNAAHAEGNGAHSTAGAAHAEGNETIASAASAHAEGYSTEATAEAAHAEGDDTQAIGRAAHSEGKKTLAQGNNSHAEGEEAKALKPGAHAEGYNTKADGYYAHTEGNQTEATGNGSHAEGLASKSIGNYSHAGGTHSRANKDNSFAHGLNVIANKDRQFVFGQYNIEDTEDKYAHIIGWGWADNNRVNIHTVDTAGNAWYKKDVYVGGTSQADGKKLATENYVTTQINALKGSAPEVYNTLEKIAAELSKDNTAEAAILQDIANLDSVATNAASKADVAYAMASSAVSTEQMANALEEKEDKYIRASKNLFDASVIEQDGLSGSNGTITFSTYTGNGYIGSNITSEVPFSTICPKAEIGRTYTLSYSGGTGSLQDATFTPSGTFVLTEEIYNSGISIESAMEDDGAAGQPSGANFYNIMLNEGSEALSYEPYFEDRDLVGQFDYMENEIKAVNTSLSKKVNVTTFKSTVYGVNDYGTQTTYSVSEDAKSKTIAYRDYSGSLKVGTAISDTHAVPLAQMNEVLAEKEDKFSTTIEPRNLFNKSADNILFGGSFSYEAQSSKTLSEFCPDLSVGEIVTFSVEFDAIEAIPPYFRVDDMFLYGNSNQTVTINQSMLDSYITVCGGEYETDDGGIEFVSNDVTVMVNRGSVALPYEPYFETKNVGLAECIDDTRNEIDELYAMIVDLKARIQELENK